MRGAPTATPALVIAAVLGAAGCVSLPPGQQQDPDAAVIVCESRGPDNDGDGYPSCGAPRNDCNDDDAAIHPGARELCGDGIDQDCGVDTDLDCADEVTANTATISGDPWTLSNEALEITFDRGTAPSGVYGPIQLRSRAGSGAQLLNTNAAVDDRFWAITRWQSAFSWRSGDSPSVFTVRVHGEAVTQVETTWADAGDIGTSTFTMYPDGRIHRHDELTVNSVDVSNNYLSSYMSFDATRVDHADWDTTTAPVLLDLAPGTSYTRHDFTDEAQSYACLFSSGTGDRVILSARPVSGADGLRVVESNFPLHRAGISFDWQHEAPVVTGAYAADILVHVGVGNGARPCQGGGGVTSPFLIPPALNGPAGAAAYDPRTGAYAVAAATQVISVTLSEPVPSLALHLTIVPNRHDPVLVRGTQRLVRGRDYLLQHGSDDAWLIVVGTVATDGLRIDWP